MIETRGFCLLTVFSMSWNSGIVFGRRLCQKVAQPFALANETFQFMGVNNCDIAANAI